MTKTEKYILIFQEGSIAIQYGIGTYTLTLQKCFDTALWNIKVMTLHKGKDNVSFYMENGIGYYEFPISKEQFILGNPYYEETYFRSIFFFLASQIMDVCKVNCHFNFTRHQILAEYFKKYMNAFITYTFHYVDWMFEVLAFVVTDKYNLRCRYCAYGDIYVDYDARIDENLSSYKAKQVLNY